MKNKSHPYCSGILISPWLNWDPISPGLKKKEKNPESPIGQS